MVLVTVWRYDPIPRGEGEGVGGVVRNVEGGVGRLQVGCTCG